MKKNGSVAIVFLLFYVLASNAPMTYAQGVKQSNAADQALRKAQGMLRQLGQEKAALESEKSELLQQLKHLEAEVKQLRPLQQDVERYRAEMGSLQGVTNKLRSNLDKAHQQEQVRSERQQKIIDQARQIQSDNQLLVNAVQEREQWIGVCAANNINLVEINQELLDQYQKKGFFQKLGKLDLLTGVANVAAENLVENYQYRLEDLAVTQHQTVIEDY